MQNQTGGTNKGDSTTLITLTPAEATLFHAFRKHQAKFKIMLDCGVFELEHGKAEINMHEGHIQNVFVYRRTYQHVSFKQG